MKNKILFAIFIVAFISSAILVSVNYSPPDSENGFCLPGEDGESTCGSVQNSRYAYLFGISNSVYGLFIFATLSVLTFLQIRRKNRNRQLLIDTSAVVGFLIAIYFIYLQIFVLNQFCKYCLVIDIGLIIAFLLIVQTEIKNRQKK